MSRNSKKKEITIDERLVIAGVGKKIKNDGCNAKMDFWCKLKPIFNDEEIYRIENTCRLQLPFIPIICHGTKIDHKNINLMSNGMKYDKKVSWTPDMLLSNLFSLHALLLNTKGRSKYIPGNDIGENTNGLTQSLIQDKDISVPSLNIKEMNNLMYLRHITRILSKNTQETQNDGKPEAVVYKPICLVQSWHKNYSWGVECKLKPRLKQMEKKIQNKCTIDYKFVKIIQKLANKDANMNIRDMIKSKTTGRSKFNEIIKLFEKAIKVESENLRSEKVLFEKRKENIEAIKMNTGVCFKNKLMSGGYFTEECNNLSAKSMGDKYKNTPSGGDSEKYLRAIWDKAPNTSENKFYQPMFGVGLMTITRNNFCKKSKIDPDKKIKALCKQSPVQASIIPVWKTEKDWTHIILKNLDSIYLIGHSSLLALDFQNNYIFTKIKKKSDCAQINFILKDGIENLIMQKKMQVKSVENEILNYCKPLGLTNLRCKKFKLVTNHAIGDTDFQQVEDPHVLNTIFLENGVIKSINVLRDRSIKNYSLKRVSFGSLTIIKVAREKLLINPLSSRTSAKNTKKIIQLSKTVLFLFHIPIQNNFLDEGIILAWTQLSLSFVIYSFLVESKKLISLPSHIGAYERKALVSFIMRGILAENHFFRQFYYYGDTTKLKMFLSLDQIPFELKIYFANGLCNLYHGLFVNGINMYLLFNLINPASYPVSDTLTKLHCTIYQSFWNDIKGTYLCNSWNIQINPMEIFYCSKKDQHKPPFMNATKCNNFILFQDLNKIECPIDSKFNKTEIDPIKEAKSFIEFTGEDWIIKNKSLNEIKSSNIGKILVKNRSTFQKFTLEQGFIKFSLRKLIKKVFKKNALNL